MNNRPKNYAPKEMEGKYDLYIIGNQVALYHHGKAKIVKCNPDDTFDIGEAMRVGIKRINEDDIIRIGDKVEIVDSGETFCAMENWEGINPYYTIHYRWGVCPENGTVGNVVDIRGMKYIIEVSNEKYLGDKKYNDLICYNPVYAIGKNGLKKIKN